MSTLQSFYQTQLFSKSCKIDIVKPILKKDSKTDPQNYRPTSLLPLLSTIIERTVYDQTAEFLSMKEILIRFQSGFRKNCSTNTCLGHLSDKKLPSSKKAFSLELF